MKLNRIVLIISVIMISIWMYNLYRNRCIKVEYYTGVSSKLRDHLTGDEKFNALFVTNGFVQMEVDDNMLQEAIDFAEMGDHKTLLELLDKAEKK